MEGTRAGHRAAPTAPPPPALHSAAPAPYRATPLPAGGPLLVKAPSGRQVLQSRKAPWLGSRWPGRAYLCPSGTAEPRCCRRPRCSLLPCLPLSPAGEATSIAAGAAAGGGRKTAGCQRGWFLFLTRLGGDGVWRRLGPGHPPPRSQGPGEEGSFRRLGPAREGFQRGLPAKEQQQ